MLEFGTHVGERSLAEPYCGESLDNGRHVEGFRPRGRLAEAFTLHTV